MALIPVPAIAAEGSARLGAPTWMLGSWGLSARGTVVSVVATPDNVTVAMTVDGTRVLDAGGTASDHPWWVGVSEGTTDAGTSLE